MTTENDTATPHIAVSGLTNDEARSRIPDIDLESIRRRQRRQFALKAARGSVFTLFNADLVGIAVIMALLGSPLGAFGAIVVIVINVSLNTFQQAFSRSRMSQLAEVVRPEVAVIRDGRLDTIPLTDVVVDDVVVVGPGDEIEVDGTLLQTQRFSVDESAIGRQDPRTPQEGDVLLPGSFVASGHALYRSSQAGLERAAHSEDVDIGLLFESYTPLQSITKVVLRFLFALVIIFSILLFADAAMTGREIVSDEYRDAFSIVFGVAPTSLFLILVVVYAMGLLRIADHGALTYRSSSVETLGGVSVICASRSSLVSGLSASIRVVPGPDGDPVVSRHRTRRILGYLVHTVPTYDKTGEMLREAVQGEKRQTTETASYLTVHGWSGAVFDEGDLRGTVVLGTVDALSGHLSWIPEDDGVGNDPFAELLALPQGQGLMNRALRRLQIWLKPKEELEEEDVVLPEDAVTSATLLMAYSPEQLSFRDESGESSVPDELLPLAFVEVAEDIRPQARRTLGALIDAGIDVKILDAEPVAKVRSTVEELGLELNESEVLSGPDLGDMNDIEFSNAVASAVAIGDLSVAQKARVLESLGENGQLAAMVGHTVSDIEAMRKAAVSVALLGSDAGVLLSADIVLLKESLSVLGSVLVTGQRIVNGALGTFKLYLSQTVSQLLLILALPLLVGGEFPYHPTHGSVISGWTIAIPNMFLSTWAAGGALTAAGMRKRLAHFVIPAAICTAILAVVVQNVVFSSGMALADAQLWVMYALLFAGWFRVLYLEPPTRFWVGGEELRGDMRVFWLLGATIASYVLIVYIPLFQGWLRIKPPESLAQMALAIVAATTWALVVRFVWRRRVLDWAADRVSNPRRALQFRLKAKDE